MRFWKVTMPMIRRNIPGLHASGIVCAHYHGDVGVFIWKTPSVNDFPLGKSHQQMISDMNKTILVLDFPINRGLPHRTRALQSLSQCRAWTCRINNGLCTSLSVHHAWLPHHRGLHTTTIWFFMWDAHIVCSLHKSQSTFVMNFLHQLCLFTLLV